MNNLKQVQNFIQNADITIQITVLAVTVLCTRGDALNPGLNRCHSGIDSRKVRVDTSNTPGHDTNLGIPIILQSEHRSTRVSLAGVLALASGTDHGRGDATTIIHGLGSLEITVTLTS